MKIIKKIISYYESNGLRHTLHKVFKTALSPIVKIYYKFRYRSAPIWKNPTKDDFRQIEEEFKTLGITLGEYIINVNKFNDFKKKYPFPVDYHGGIDSDVWEEKMLEHFVAYDLLELAEYQKDDQYIDVAASSSPWAKMLRSHNIKSFAIDLNKPSEEYANLDYYMTMNATKTNFKTNSISGISLQCAFEMFAGYDDVKLIPEMKRILRDSGKMIVSPLYMHTEACHFSSPDFFAKNNGDIDSQEYIMWDYYGIYMARFYSVEKIIERILKPIESESMQYNLYVVKNKKELNANIYMHYILEIINNSYSRKVK